MVSVDGDEPGGVSELHAEAIGEVGNSVDRSGGFSAACPANRKLVMMLEMKWNSLAKVAVALRKWALGLCLAVAVIASPRGAMAVSTNDDDAAPPDGRLQNYEKPVELQSTSTALMWLLLIVLGVV